MKNLLFSLSIILLIQVVAAQTNKFSIGIEYCPSFSNVTSPRPYSDEGFRVSHNAFIKTDFEVKTNLQLTLGAGILNTRQFQSLDFADLQDIKKIDFYINHNYFVVPFGLKYNFGSFYINPEASFAIDVGHPVKQITYFSDGEIVEEHSISFRVPVTVHNLRAVMVPRWPLD